MLFPCSNPLERSELVAWEACEGAWEEDSVAVVGPWEAGAWADQDHMIAVHPWATATAHHPQVPLQPHPWETDTTRTTSVGTAAPYPLQEPWTDGHHHPCPESLPTGTLMTVMTPTTACPHHPWADAPLHPWTADLPPWDMTGGMTLTETCMDPDQSMLLPYPPALQHQSLFLIHTNTIFDNASLNFEGC